LRWGSGSQGSRGCVDLGDDAGEVGAGEEEAVERRVGVGGGSPGGWCGGGGGGCGRRRLAEQGLRRRARLVDGDDAERAPPRRRLGSKALLHSLGEGDGDWGLGRGAQRSGREGSGKGGV